MTTTDNSDVFEEAKGLKECSDLKKCGDLKEGLLETAQKIVDQAPQAIRLTPLGEKRVYKKEGRLCEDPELSVLPYEREKPLNVTLHDLMCTLYTAAQYIIKSGRLIPVTRDELIKPQKEGGCTEWGYKKGDVQKLEKMGLVSVSHSYLQDKTSKKMVGARVVVYPTALGRGYIKKFVDRGFLVGEGGSLSEVIDDKI